MGQFTRIKRVKQDRFTAVSNEVLMDRELSLKAKAFLILIMSLHDDWDFTIRGITKVVKEGRDAVYSAIQELISAGYCRRYQSPGQGGKFGEFVYEFYEEKQGVQPHTAFPYTEQPHTDSPYTENPPQVNTKLIKEQINKKLKEEGAAKKTADAPPQEDPWKDLRPDPPNLKDPVPSMDPFLLLQGTFPTVPRRAAEAVRGTVLDTRLWTRVLGEWKAKGYRGDNVDGMLERYRKEAKLNGERDDRGLLIHRMKPLERVH